MVGGASALVEASARRVGVGVGFALVVCQLSLGADEREDKPLGVERGASSESSSLRGSLLSY